MLLPSDDASADEDPIRRQLAGRAQTLGIRLQPKVAVELEDVALRLVAAGVGDTYLRACASSSRRTCARSRSGSTGLAERHRVGR